MMLVLFFLFTLLMKIIISFTVKLNDIAERANISCFTSCLANLSIFALEFPTISCVIVNVLPSRNTFQNYEFIGS